MTFTYVRHIPAPPLSSYIDYFWHFDGAMTYAREKSLPSSAAVLIINFAGSIRMSSGNQNETGSAWAEAWWMGPWSRYHVVEWPEHVQQIGVSFKPAGAYPFLGLPVAELHNRYVSLDDIEGQLTSEIRERLYWEPTVTTKFTLLEKLLLIHLNEASQGFNIVQYAAAKIIEHAGSMSIKSLCDHIGISQNHLVTQFNRMVGLSPKELARHYRLMTVLRSTNPTQLIDWTQTALQFGYYDLSHLNKDFVAFTGHSPTGYMKLLRQKHHDDPQYHHLPRLLAID
jgi:AraC-like DNA-binding protein